MIRFINIFDRFEFWFNRNFGWFFINGRKTSEKIKAIRKIQL